MQRIISPFWAIAGIVFVAALILLGVNLYRAAQTGPRWRRRLIAAALTALTGFGLVSPVKAGEAVTFRADADKDLTNRREWKEFIVAWNDAAQIAANKPGAYRFETDQTKQEFLNRLQTASGHCDALATAGLLTAAEAGLLKAGLEDLTRSCARFCGKTMMMVMCYRSGPAGKVVEGAARLQARLDLLQTLAEQPTVHREVLALTLADIERDLSALADEKSHPHLSQGKTNIRDAAAESIRKIKAKPGDDLTTTKEWMSISNAWEFCAPLAKSGESTEIQRKQADAKLNVAGKAIAALLAAHILAGDEAQLLQQESTRLRTDIDRNPPTDSRVTCYAPAFILPAQESLARLNQRLPLLKKLVATGALHLSVAEKLFPALEADLQTLGDEKKLEQLPEAERAKARQMRRQAEEILPKLRP